MKNKHSKKSDIQLSLVIPFFNEDKNVDGVLNSLAASLNREKIKYEIIAVDNGSFDDTGILIDKLKKKNGKIKKLWIRKNQGYGYAIRRGLSMCKGDYIGYLWGDNQISPEAIPKLLHKLKDGQVSLCKISRVSRTESAIRRIQSYLYNSMMRIFFGVQSRDINGCPKIMKSDVYKSLNIKSSDWFIDPEILIKCKRKGYKIKEVSVTPIDRKAGVSKVSFRTTLEFIKNIFRYRIWDFE